MSKYRVENADLQLVIIIRKPGKRQNYAHFKVARVDQYELFAQCYKSNLTDNFIDRYGSYTGMLHENFILQTV